MSIERRTRDGMVLKTVEKFQLKFRNLGLGGVGGGETEISLVCERVQKFFGFSFAHTLPQCVTFAPYVSVLYLSSYI